MSFEASLLYRDRLLHAKVFVINNNKKDERMKVCTSKFLWSTTQKKEINEWKVCTLKLFHQEQEGWKNGSLHTKSFVVVNNNNNKNDERMKSLHIETFVINNKKDERMKSLHIETFDINNKKEERMKNLYTETFDIDKNKDERMKV